MLHLNLYMNVTGVDLKNTDELSQVSHDVNLFSVIVLYFTHPMNSNFTIWY